MNIVWSPTALEQLDETYNIISIERDVATATKWFLKINDAVASASPTGRSVATVEAIWRPFAYTR